MTSSRLSEKTTRSVVKVRSTAGRRFFFSRLKAYLHTEKHIFGQLVRLIVKTSHYNSIIKKGAFGSARGQL